MLVSIADAAARLDDLIELAQAGEEGILTRNGQPVIRLVPIKHALSAEERGRILRDFQKSVAGKALPGESAARSQDFLYTEDGLPE
jgi:prevent-host-death family protein